MGVLSTLLVGSSSTPIRSGPNCIDQVRSSCCTRPTGFASQGSVYLWCLKWLGNRLHGSQNPRSKRYRCARPGGLPLPLDDHCSVHARWYKGVLYHRITAMLISKRESRMRHHFRPKRTEFITPRPPWALFSWAENDDPHFFRGRRIVTVTPCPSPSLVTAIVPPCASTIARVMASPRPVPLIPRLRDWSVR